MKSVSLHVSVPYAKIKPNPFRHMERYPVSEWLVEELMGSMARNGFWPNIIGRKRGEFIELAYGHHRWIAFGKKFGKAAEMNIIVQDLNDAQMLRYMADENMPDAKKSAVVEQETIRAVVLAYAEGKIELRKPKSSQGARWRHAPSFLQADGTFKGDKSFPYNAESIAHFLGWWSGDQVSPRVRNALIALEAMESEIIAEEDFQDLSSKQAQQTVVEARRIEKAHRISGASPEKAKEKAREAAKDVAAELRTRGGRRSGDGIGVRDTEHVANTHLPNGAPPPARPTPKYDAIKRWDDLMGHTAEFQKWVIDTFGAMGDGEPDYNKMIESPQWNEKNTSSCIPNIDAHLEDFQQLKQAMMDSLEPKDRKRLQQAGY